MKESQISDALRESMNAVRLSPALRARALCAMRGSEERRPKMKRKFSAALAFALVGVLVVAVALALIDKLRVVPRQKDNGMLRFYIFSMLLFVKGVIFQWLSCFRIIAA